MLTKYEQIVDVHNIASRGENTNLSEVEREARRLPYIIGLAENESLPPATCDAKRVLLLNIDMQNDFMEGIGSLAVPGSKGDVERLTRWIYDNMNKITQIMCSLDTHSEAQIFHPSWWEDEEGNHPAPFTPIKYDDVAQGKWRPLYPGPVWSEEKQKLVQSMAYSQEYVKALGEMRIWPYHCLAGTFGAGLEGEFAKMLYFHSAARKSRPALIQKGSNPYSEMYGIIKAEYDPSNFLNTPVLTAVESFDEIYLAGEAASHCLKISGLQILEYFANRLDVTQKITILEDCTSPIPGCEKETLDAFNGFKAQYGIRVAKSTDIQL